MFGRSRRDEEARAEAAREAERRALFEQLAKRPETVCPFLGLADDRVGYEPNVTDEHRCYAFGDPAPLSSEQQSRVCLDRGYGNCPRYLRGVLVIPTEELEALRHPMAKAPPPPEPEPERRRRRGLPLAAVLLLLLLLVGAGAGGWLYLSGGLPFIAAASPTPTPSASATQPVSASSAPSASATPADTPTPGTPTPEPTPTAGDVFRFFEVAVTPGDYTLYRVVDGTIADTRGATYSRNSQAPVECRDLGGGAGVHWVTQEGEYSGLSYIAGRSGPFGIRAVYRRPDGTRSSHLLTDEELAGPTCAAITPE